MPISIEHNIVLLLKEAEEIWELKLAAGLWGEAFYF